MIRFGDFLRISTMSIALLGGAALTVAVIAPDVAYAGKGNGKGNGGGNGNAGGKDNAGGKGNAGGHGASGGDSVAKGKAVGKGHGGTRGKSGASRDPIRAITDMLRGKSSDAKTRRTTRTSNKKAATRSAPKVTAAPAPKPRGNPLARELGVHPSELGALNAAHASPNALANASPNSRVGKIAMYMGEVEASRELAAELDAAEAELAMLDEPTRSQEEIDAAIETANGEKAGLESELAALQQALSETEGDSSAIADQIAEVETALTEKNGEIADLEQERADGEAYAMAQDEVERLEGELETQEADQRMALEEAANKPVTDEVEAAVQKLLGIFEEPGVVEDDDIAIVIEDEVIVVE